MTEDKPKDPFDYGESPPKSPVTLAELEDLAEQLVALDAVVAEKEAELAEATKRASMLRVGRLPEVMKDLGLKSFQTKFGLTIKIKPTLRAAPPKDRREECWDWLDEHGHGGLVKRIVSIAFNREQAEAAAQLLTELRPRFPDTKTERWVEPATFTAWVRGRRERGEEVDVDLFGVFEQDEAVVELPGKPRSRKSR